MKVSQKAFAYSSVLSDNLIVNMAQEGEVTILIGGSVMDVRDALHNSSRVSVADQEASNGVVHLIARV